MCSPNSDKVLILTPLKNAESHLAEYFELLHKLTYPRPLISLGFLESDSADNTYAELQRRLDDLSPEFRSTMLWKKDFGFVIPPGVARWATEIQIQRRSTLARSRNHLLFRALQDEDWVLWIDVDIVGCPADVIEQLLETGKDIVHPHCVRESDLKTFDLNAWSDRGKRNMGDLRQDGDLVRLHAVGGSMLLVRADLHRDGLIFPPFLFGRRSPLIRSSNHLSTGADILKKYSLLDILRRRFQGEIETEGLGIMAYEMGYECWGMPNLEILHKVNELMDPCSSPPVAFLIFNRPELTRKVFAAIARAKPSKLLVVADGPRADVPSDREKCSEARAVIDRIDWDCEVLTNYSSVNMGCRARISTGLDWVFTNVEEAIILEDDCIPHPTFFRFCKELLARYQDDQRVMMISGSNFQMGRKWTPYSYYFSRFFHCRGWATWRRAWKHYDIDMELWPVLKDGSWLLHVLGDKAQARTFRKIFNDVADRADTGNYHTWDHRWAFSCMVRNCLSIVPSRNLVTNVGFSEDRTSVRYHPLGNLPVEQLEFPLEHPPFMVRQADADAFEHGIEYGWFRRAKWTWRLRQSVAYHWENPGELLPSSYRAVRDLVPLEWRRQIRDRLGLPHGISLIAALKIAALKRRSEERTRSPLAHVSDGPESVSLIGPYNARSGLGESFRSIIRACQAAGIWTSVYDMGSPDKLPSSGEERAYSLKSDRRRAIFNILHFGADLIPTAYKIFGSGFFSRRYNIGYWVWETEKLPESWRPYVKAVDEIWTPSAFCRHIFSRETDVPVFRMPHNVAPKPPAGINRRELGLPDEGFIFLVMADFRSIAERKNPLGAIEAFSRAFGSKRKGVFLCLKTMGAHCGHKMMQAMGSFFGKSDSIIHLDYAFDRSRIDALINASDCLVSLHRSEGFGLPIAEAMYLGKPVIATGYSGNMDFMNMENSFPVRFKLVELDENIGPFEKGAHWAEPDVEHAAELMRKVSGDPDLCASVGMRAASKIRTDFSLERIGGLVRSRLERIIADNSALPGR